MRIRFTGQDNESADFDVESHTDPSVVYDVRIDYHAGRIKCNCMDAVCRRKDAPIAPYQGLGCKHIRDLCLYLEQVGVFGQETEI